MRVLIIDDDRDHRETVAHILQHASSTKFKPLQAGTIAQGVELLQGGGVDVILLDMTLPDARGPEGFRQLFYQWPHIPIVMVSGTKNEELAYGFIVGGAQDYLVKGEFGGESLTRAILYACARHTFRLVNSELGQVRRSLAVMTEQMENMQTQYRELLQSVEGINQTLTHPPEQGGGK